MTQTQKIIADALGIASIDVGKRVYIKEEKGSVSLTDELCGAYGKVFLKNGIFEVPQGVFADLRTAVRNDAKSEDIAEFMQKTLSQYDIEGRSVEIGGDSLTYLTMDDRIAIVKEIMRGEKKPFCVIFEYDFVTAEYTLENFGKKPEVFFNDGPESYREIIPIELERA